MNMRERIARALCRANNLSFDDFDDPTTARWRRMADAVLEAMMEPSPEMVEAGARAGVDQIYHKNSAWDRCVGDEFKDDHLNYAKYAFIAMLTAAKG